ncbi:MAG: hypothetical protein IPJ74_26050 [Saprospiraceae bacterium]|nr:hypothetical protein [Saprospiraceae bacterium]
MNRLFVILLCLGFGISLNAQSKDKLSEENWNTIHTWEDTLAILGYAVVNDSIEDYRFAACRNMIQTLVKALKTENSFQYPFERLKTVSIQYPQDSSFRIFTWQLYVDKDDYRYYGAIQMNTPELKLYPLIDRSALVTNVEQSELTPDNWYGSLYYTLKECKGPNGKYYLLFGFDGYEFFRKRKIVDVLTFKDGKPVFGAPVFVHQEKGKPSITKKRLFLEYSAETSVRLNYDEALELLIFDHLIPMEGTHGQGPVMVPDGSYEGYEYEKGLWKYQTMVLHQVMEEAPRPYPILDEREKNILGKKGKN